MPPYSPDSKEFRQAVAQTNELLPGINTPNLTKFILDEQIDLLHISYPEGSTTIEQTVRFGDGDQSARFAETDLVINRELSRSGGWVYHPGIILVKVN